ncbi:Magnesium and cobalt efflux protein CorC [Lactococcus garvieae]|nr:Magnesium and cobalt efflux protein CorC [Lactococcus garvieae]
MLSVIDNPTHFLSTVQVGITFLNIVAGASLADTLAAQLAPLFGDTSFAQTLSKIIILVILTFFTIVFGELFPKRIAQALKEKAALKMVRPLMAIGVVLKPFIWLLTITINGLARIFPIKFDSSDDDMTRDEIEYLVHTDETALDDSEREMITGVFSLDELVAREIMVPRKDAFMIDINDDPRENIEKMLSESYSRVPVYDDDKDNILGIIHTKRILARGFADGFDNIDFREMLQEPLFVPETVFVDDLMLQMRNTQNQMAILLNEYGGVEGIVTLEDLIEEIVGEIEDETDIAEAEVHKIGENMYVVQGKMTINDFNDEFGTHLVNKDVDTMAGFFLSETGQIPEKGQQVMCKIDNLEDHFSLTSLEVDGNRILKLRVEFDVELPE